MTDPLKVKGFLDVGGAWDPSLILVMAGGLLVYGLGYWLIAKPKGKSLTGAVLQLPDKKRIDSPLILGSALFGIGWGLLGICPGPAIALISSLDSLVLLFVVAMLSGMWLVKIYRRIF